MHDREPIPLHLLTGFLGSGKTTLLTALLREPGAERLGVLVNEVGALALDHWLLERMDEDVLMLASGCVCCELRGELVAALERVLTFEPTRIVVETTGLADPAPILHGLRSDPRLRALVRPAGVIAAVDALRVEDLLATQLEVRQQLEFADRVVLTKSDLAPQRVASALDLVGDAAPGCEVRAVEHGRVDPDWLFAAPPLARLSEPAGARRWLHHHSHAAEPSFRSHSFELEHAADLQALELWLRLVTQLDGPRLLRIKGLVEDRATGDVFALQAAGRSVSPALRLGPSTRTPRGVHFVIVERNFGEAPLQQLLTSLEEAARA